MSAVDIPWLTAILKTLGGMGALLMRLWIWLGAQKDAICYMILKITANSSMRTWVAIGIGVVVFTICLSVMMLGLAMLRQAAAGCSGDGGSFDVGGIFAETMAGFVFMLLDAYLDFNQWCVAITGWIGLWFAVRIYRAVLMVHILIIRHLGVGVAAVPGKGG